MRVAWFSLLNPKDKPTDSLSAYFTDEVFPSLKDLIDIDFFVSDENSYPYKTYSFLRAFEMHRKRPYDIFFYQVEDKKECDFIRMHLGVRPGIVLYHDLFFKSDPPPPLTFSIWQDVLEAYLAQAEIRFPAKKPQDFSDPFALREASLALVPLFSSTRLCGEFRRRVLKYLGRDLPIPNIFYLPHPVSYRPEQENAIGTLKAAFCGSTELEGRAHKVLPAIKKEGFNLIWMIKRSEKEKAEDLLREFGVSDVDLITGKSPARWREVVSKASVAIHTHFSAYGGLGPYPYISLSQGVPIVTCDFAEGESLPDDIAIKINPGRYEGSQLSQALESIKCRREFFEGPYRKIARDYIEEFHQSSLIADELLKVFNSKQDPAKRALYKWEEILKQGREYLFKKASENPLCDIISGSQDKDLGIASVWSSQIGEFAGICLTGSEIDI
ncbi:MAG: hypothetical protein D6808_00240 [Candidatus Dadabacteria bacterium]|nr:MAG: hypothetical protein D6808_00240 [Candidatus Dadabacteria bacterium]